MTDTQTTLNFPSLIDLCDAEVLEQQEEAARQEHERKEQAIPEHVEFMQRYFERVFADTKIVVSIVRNTQGAPYFYISGSGIYQVNDLLFVRDRRKSSGTSTGKVSLLGCTAGMLELDTPLHPLELTAKSTVIHRLSIRGGRNPTVYDATELIEKLNSLEKIPHWY